MEVMKILIADSNVLAETKEFLKPPTVLGTSLGEGLEETKSLMSAVERGTDLATGDPEESEIDLVRDGYALPIRVLMATVEM